MKKKPSSKKIFISITFLVFLLSLIGFTTSGQSSESGFNAPNGFFLYKSEPKNNDSGRAVAIQPDGKIVILGLSYDGKNNRTLVLRLNSDGTRDNAFGTNGVFTYGGKEKGSFFGSGIALQPDGKIVVVGDSSYGKSKHVFVMRCNSDGLLDSTFGEGGVTTYKSRANESQDMGSGVALDSDAKIVVVGSTHDGKNRQAMILRYNGTGTLDSSFGKGGVVTHSGLSDADLWGRSVAIQPDGKVVMVGYSNTGKKCDVLTVRYDADGSPDKTFGEGGVALSSCPPGGHDWGRSIVIQPDKKLIVAGNTRSGGKTYTMLLRYNADGKPDKTFGNGGFASTADNRNDWGQTVTLMPDGKIVIVGNTVSVPKYVASVVRHNHDGTLDRSFGKDGIVVMKTPPDSNNWVFAAVTQPDGKIVLVGRAKSGKTSEILIVRYKTDGTLDVSL